MPKNKEVSVPTSSQNQIKLDNPWPVDVDILILILEWFRREDLANFQLVCRFSNVLMSSFRDHLKRGLAPLDCVSVINATRARILPVTTPIRVSDLREHWSHSDNTFRRLCSVRSLSYFYAHQSAESDQFIKEIVQLTIAALKKSDTGFLKNLYLRDLIVLIIFIEVYHHNKYLIAFKNNNKEYKLSDLANILLIKSNNYIFSHILYY